MLSQTAEYALRAVVFLARHGAERPLTAREVAEATTVPPDYLGKILSQLVRAALVRSRRGVGGGFALARDAEDLSVLDVVNAVDPLQRVEGCPLGLVEHRQALCPLHRVLDRAAADLERALGETSIGSLVGGDAAGGSPCTFPGSGPGGGAPPRGPLPRARTAGV